MEQDGEDEPASDLLKQCRNGKAELVQRGMAKRDKPLPKLSGAVRLIPLGRKGPDPTPTFMERWSRPPMFDAPSHGSGAVWVGRSGAVGR